MFNKPAYRWASLAWQARAEAWIRESLKDLGSAPEGPIEGVRFLPWSAVLRVRTSRGGVYFKACGPSQSHEPALAAMLGRDHPDKIIPVLAFEEENSWFLMSDGGQTLTAAIQSPADGPAHWRRVLQLVAAIQRDYMSRPTELLATGLPDRRPAALPGVFARLLGEPERLLAGGEKALSELEINKLIQLAPRVAELCDELASIGPTATFVHDDLHEDHVFIHQLPGGPWHYVLFDFGDACLSHPFMQLVSQPRFIANRFKLEVEPAFDSLCEFYLDLWGDFAPRDRLRRGLAIALALGGIIRALTWVNAVGDHLDELDDFLRETYARRVADWLRQTRQKIVALDAR